MLLPPFQNIRCFGRSKWPTKKFLYFGTEVIFFIKVLKELSVSQFPLSIYCNALLGETRTGAM
jgi:hypothetical protein